MIMANGSQTVVSNSSLESFLLSGQTAFNGSFIRADEIERYNCYQYPIIGKALSTRLLYEPVDKQTNKEIDTSCDEVCEPNYVWNSILSLLGFDMDPSGCQFKYVHCNTVPTNDEVPFRLLNIERVSNGDYLFRSDDYILMKIGVPFQPRELTGGNLVKVRNPNPNDLAQNPTLYSCDGDRPDSTNLFAYVRLNSIGGNRSNEFDANPLYFYNRALDKVNSIFVQFTNRDGVPLRLKQDHHFTIEINEIQDVLQHTNMDSRHGDYNFTGLKQYDDTYPNLYMTTS